MRTYDNSTTTLAAACHLCHQSLTLSKVRKNHYASATCKVCNWQHSFWVGKDLIPLLSYLGRRFSNNGTTWHATYRTDTKATKFIVVQYRAKQGDGHSRKEYSLPGLVESDRFIALLPFL